MSRPSAAPESTCTTPQRLKGRKENALLQMPFKAVFRFRPAYAQPIHGIRTKTTWYGAAYALMRPLYPLCKMLFPNYVTTTECGRSRHSERNEARFLPTLFLRIATSTGCVDEVARRLSFQFRLVGVRETQGGSRHHTAATSETTGYARA
jgi:hypothetical protein